MTEGLREVIRRRGGSYSSLVSDVVEAFGAEAMDVEERIKAGMVYRLAQVDETDLVAQLQLRHWGPDNAAGLRSCLREWLKTEGKEVKKGREEMGRL